MRSTNDRSRWRQLFSCCSSALLTGGVGISIAKFLLPLLVLDALIFGASEEEELIMMEIKVSERSERALRKTSILAMDLAKWLQTATSTTKLTLFHSIGLAYLVRSCFIKNAPRFARRSSSSATTTTPLLNATMSIPRLSILCLTFSTRWRDGRKQSGRNQVAIPPPLVLLRKKTHLKNPKQPP